MQCHTVTIGSVSRVLHLYAWPANPFAGTNFGIDSIGLVFLRCASHFRAAPNARGSLHRRKFARAEMQRLLRTRCIQQAVNHGLHHRRAYGVPDEAYSIPARSAI